MKNKLDKNSKLQSGKSKEATPPASKAKAKPGLPASKPSVKPDPEASSKTSAKTFSQTSSPSKKAKSAPDPKSSKAPAEAKGASVKAASAKGKAQEAKSVKPPSKADRETPAPVSNRPAGAAARPRPQTSSDATDTDVGLEEFTISIIKPGETKERIWRTKSFQQLPAQREFGFPDVAPELPGQYGQPNLVLMPKDPEYMFCYWELTPDLIEQKQREKLPSGNYRETLKINWESKSLFEPNFTFIPVFFWARKWYFGVPQVGQRYQVELGWLSDSGHFISIIRSNLSELPESWAATQKRLSEQGEVLAYTSSRTKTLGASEHLVVEDARAFIPEWNLSSESMSSSSWSRGVSAPSADDSAAAAPKPPKTRAVAPKARLEVSGKVLPGTTVFVGGASVPVDRDGFFKTEYPYDKDVLKLDITSRSGASRSFTYDLKELVLS